MVEAIRPATREERVISIISNLTGVARDQVDHDKTLRQLDSHHDSLTDVELIIELEVAFLIEIDDLTTANLRGQKVQAYIDYIATRKDIK